MQRVMAAVLLSRFAYGESEDHACNDANDMAHLSYSELAVASGAMAVVMLASWYLELGLEARFGIATVRTVLQLSVLGYILEPIFGLEQPAHVAAVFVGLVAFMLFVVVFESTSRLTCSYPGIGKHILIALVGGLSFNVTLAVLIVDPTPLWSPRYLVPLFGMLLGASCTACCLALGELMKGLQTTAGDSIEFLLANGASRHDAAKELKKTAVSTGIIPTLNTMNIIGLVSIPGLMTGQMLGGTSPTEAARYQMLIMFVISSCACTAVIIVVSLCLNTVLDGDDCLRRDLLIPKEQGEDLLIQACRQCATVPSRCYSYICSCLTGGPQGYEECGAVRGPQQAPAVLVECTELEPTIEHTELLQSNSPPTKEIPQIGSSIESKA